MIALSSEIPILLPQSIRRALARLLAIVPLAAAAAADASSDALDEIVVTSQRRPQPALRHVGNIERLSEAQLAAVRHQHAHELFTRVAGVWVSRGSGQENLTAIRSPVLTGAGSCGAFLTLEDGIPTRPAGFCNVNQLFEINSEQATAVEVIRGPGNALYGSNALHGIVNVIMPAPGDVPLDHLGVEVGANDFLRLRARVPFGTSSPLGVSVVYADDGGFRDDTGYRQAKAHAKYATEAGGGELTFALSVSDLDQETAGFIVGEDAYKDATLRTSNPNPEAFRNASSQRLSALWSRRLGNADLELRPFVRRSRMRFLQHFLPGKPLEENGHVSVGSIATLTFDRDDARYIVGTDVEWSDVFLRETQDGPTVGSPFLVETRPPGKHYDYDVVSVGIAPFVQAEWRLGDALSVSAGVRAEYVEYDYDNRMLDGNTRDDGSACGFGGCLYTRPGDRRDSFTNVAPSVGLSYALGSTAALYANAARGFRAPQMTELYRLQSGQQVADLDSERVDGIEFGLRTGTRQLSLDVNVFAMNKRDSVFRDADGFNVSGAKSRHDGVELTLDALPSERVRVSLAATYARHRYDFDRVAARGETFVSDRDVDTAPRWLASAELLVSATPTLDLSVQLTHTGAYYVDAENRFDYPGHTLAHLRTRWAFSESMSLTLRLNNVADTEYADRADFAFGNFRYFPGRGRELFLEFAYRHGG